MLQRKIQMTEMLQNNKKVPLARCPKREQSAEKSCNPAKNWNTAAEMDY